MIGVRCGRGRCLAAALTRHWLDVVLLEGECTYSWPWHSGASRGRLYFICVHVVSSSWPWAQAIEKHTAVYIRGRRTC